MHKSQKMSRIVCFTPELITNYMDTMQFRFVFHLAYISGELNALSNLFILSRSYLYFRWWTLNSTAVCIFVIFRTYRFFLSIYVALTLISNINLFNNLSLLNPFANMTINVTPRHQRRQWRQRQWHSRKIKWRRFKKKNTILKVERRTTHEWIHR